MWARLAPFPFPYRSAFNLRLDLDENYPEDYARFAEARRPLNGCSTHFVSTGAYGDVTPVLDDPAYVVGAGADTRVVIGCLLDAVNALAAVASAVAFYPVARRLHESLALGFVTTRLFEAAVIMVGVVSLLTVVTLRTDVVGTAGTDPASLLTAGHTMVAVYTWTFLLSQSLMPVFVDLLLGYLLYRSGLVPRILPLIAFVGAPLLLVSDLAIFVGVYENVSPLALVAAIPVAVFEFSFGVYLIVKGFKPGAAAALQAGQAVR